MVIDNKTKAKEFSNNDTISTNRKPDSISLITCNDFLYQLVNTSSLDPELKKINYAVAFDDIYKDSLFLKVTQINTERNEDMVISWLEIDIRKKKLLDVTIDFENPKELRFDSSLMNKILSHCIPH